MKAIWETRNGTYGEQSNVLSVTHSTAHSVEIIYKPSPYGKPAKLRVVDVKVFDCGFNPDWPGN
jgi:hypothetical protein